MAKMTREQARQMLIKRKVYVKNMSKEIQEKLFEIGITWVDGDKNVSNKNHPFLFIDNTGILSSTNTSVFYESGFKETFPEEILCIELTDIKVDTFDNYQKIAMENEVWPKQYSFIFPALGIAGEAGEVAEKVKKILRDKDGEVDETDRLEIVKELGDVLWYISAMAYDLGYTLQEVAEENIRKIHSRRERGKIHGNGDNR